ncbi:hypothetical protein ACPA2L_30570 [Bacillus bombysepticus]
MYHYSGSLQNNPNNFLKRSKNYNLKFFHQSADLIEHPLKLKTNTEVVLYYFKGLTNDVTLKDNVITPLLRFVNKDAQIFDSNIITAHTEKAFTWDKVVKGVLDMPLFL